MKIALASDLHFEFHEDGGAELAKCLPAADVLVCAGDLTTILCGFDRSVHALCRRYEHVVFVAGNHEFYHSSIVNVRGALADLTLMHSNFHFLDNSTCLIAGQRFVGSTMWFPRQTGIETLHRYLNDFELIQDADRIYEENTRAQDFLAREVSRDDVVVTHHLPSYRSVHPRYAGDPINCFFVCEQDALIERAQPRYWLHGHTHSSCRYSIGRTEVVCNPFGYFGHAVNQEFSNLVLEV